MIFARLPRPNLLIKRPAPRALAPHCHQAPGRPLRAVAAAAAGLWVCMLHSPAARAATESALHPLPGTVSAALQAGGIPPEAVSMLVLPAEGGPARLDHLGHTVRQPASVMKLLTTGVALRTLGPAFTWHTDVALGGPMKARGVLAGPLYIRGSGDPSLVLEKTQLMMQRWRAAGLRHIRGDIVLDRSAWALPAHDPAAFDGQALKPYNAGPDVLLLNHQAITLRLAPDAAQPTQVRVSMEPELDGVRVDAQVALQADVPCGEWREALDLRLSSRPGKAPHARQAWVISLNGPYPTSCGERDWPLLWQGDGPGDHTARLLTATWRQLGGSLSGRVRDGLWPEAGTAWQRWVSPPLAVVVRDINKFSNNVMARQLFLTLAQDSRPATLEQARALVTQHVQAATPDGHGGSACQGDALALDNGSGLSRHERASAWCLGRWMQAMLASPVMPEWLASLPLTGQDGTARRWSGVRVPAHIKTGSLDGVAAVAGVVEATSGRRQIVIGLVNHPHADAARPALEALLNWAARDQAP